jgi:hypothetical protein
MVVMQMGAELIGMEKEIAKHNHGLDELFAGSEKYL